MTIQKKIRVLVVDDSLVFREVLSRGIASDPNIEVVAVAANPFEARDKIIEYEPDVMTCDIEMPQMSGIEFIRRLIPQYPLPSIVVSTVSEAVFDAMDAGAVDFIAKPGIYSERSLKSFINELTIKIKIASTAKVPIKKDGKGSETSMGDTCTGVHKALIAIGASTGGTEAIFNILKNLPESVPGIVIVQHIPPVFSRMFAERLNQTTHLRAKEAQTGDIIQKGLVLVAPGNEHMRVLKSAGRYQVECFKGEKINGHCPSVDILFESVAKEAGNLGIGLILTGMGYDGARGLLSMKRKGARTIGQDEKSSVVYGMPKVAYDIGAVEKQVALENIPGVLLSMVK